MDLSPISYAYETVHWLGCDKIFMDSWLTRFQIYHWLTKFSWIRGCIFRFTRVCICSWVSWDVWRHVHLIVKDYEMGYVLVHGYRDIIDSNLLTPTWWPNLWQPPWGGKSGTSWEEFPDFIEVNHELMGDLFSGSATHGLTLGVYGNI